MKPIFPLPIDGSRRSSQLSTSVDSIGYKSLPPAQKEFDINATNYHVGKIYKPVIGKNAMELVDNVEEKKKIKSAFDDFDAQQKHLNDLITKIKTERQQTSMLRQGSLETLRKWANAQDSYNTTVKWARARNTKFDRE